MGTIERYELMTDAAAKLYEALDILRNVQAPGNVTDAIAAIAERLYASASAGVEEGEE